MQSHDWDLSEYMYCAYYEYADTTVCTLYKFTELLYLAQMEYMRETDGRPLFAKPFKYRIPLAAQDTELLMSPMDCEDAFFKLEAGESFENTEYYPNEHEISDLEFAVMDRTIEEYAGVEEWALMRKIRKYGAIQKAGLQCMYTRMLAEVFPWDIWEDAKNEDCIATDAEPKKKVVEAVVNGETYLAQTEHVSGRYPWTVTSKDQDAIAIVKNYILSDLIPKGPAPDFEVCITWKCKAFQNWKYMLDTTLQNSSYYELTYDGDRHMWYLDVYEKTGHIELRV